LKYSLKKECSIHFAWDDPKIDIVPFLNNITQYIKPYLLCCYVLIGFWSDESEDIYRVETLRKYNIKPFVMPFNRSDPYQVAFARWVNRPWIFNSVNWDQYKYNPSFNNSHHAFPILDDNDSQLSLFDRI
jgi:hypothetical protein